VGSDKVAMVGWVPRLVFSTHEWITWEGVSDPRRLLRTSYPSITVLDLFTYAIIWMCIQSYIIEYILCFQSFNLEKIFFFFIIFLINIKVALSLLLRGHTNDSGSCIVLLLDASSCFTFSLYLHWLQIVRLSVMCIGS
jgi:hypothetical protein